MKVISRKESLIELVFGDEEDGNERRRSFLLREQSARKAGLLLARLDAVVQSANGYRDGKPVPSEEMEQHFFEVAAVSMDPVLLSMLTRPRDGAGPPTLEDMADLTDSQKQELLAAQCALNDFSEELMGKLKSLLVQIHAIRFAGVMIEHLEATSLSPPPSSTVSPELIASAP